MTTTRNERKIAVFVECCSAFKIIATKYLQFQPRQRYFLLSLFQSTSNREKIANSIIDSVEKITFNINYPIISFDNRIQFLYRLNEINLQTREILLNLNKLDDNFLEMSHDFFSQLKVIVHNELSGEIHSIDDVNLHYLNYYFDAVSVGLDCPTNYVILKERILNSLTYYIHCNPKKTVTKTIITWIDLINNDSNCINQYAKNHNQKFHNLLSFLYASRLFLINKQENLLLSRIGKIIGDALGRNRLSFNYLCNLYKTDKSRSNSNTYNWSI